MLHPIFVMVAFCVLLVLNACVNPFWYRTGVDHLVLGQIVRTAINFTRLLTVIQVAKPLQGGRG